MNIQKVAGLVADIRGSHAADKARSNLGWYEERGKSSDARAVCLNVLDVLQAVDLGHRPTNRDGVRADTAYRTALTQIASAAGVAPAELESFIRNEL